MLPYGRKFSTYEMDVQVSHSIYTQIREKSNILQGEGRFTENHKRPVQVERSRDIGRAYDAGPHTSTAVNTAEDKSFRFHGVSQREECNDDFRYTC